MKLIIHLVDENSSTLIPNLLAIPNQALVIGKNPHIDKYFSHILCVDEQGVSLLTNDSSKTTATRVDFLHKGLLFRRDSSGKSKGIAKAVGIAKLAYPTVLDATAGLAKDAFILASLGCSITLLERSPLVHALLADGFRRGLASGDATVCDALERMTLYYQDAHEYFAKIKHGEITKPDVIYLDPMFPSRSKSAKVKKDISILQQVLGPDDDFDLMFATARPCAKRRVVVKRPGKNRQKTDLIPAFQITGKSAHFDVYV